MTSALGAMASLSSGSSATIDVADMARGPGRAMPRFQDGGSLAGNESSSTSSMARSIEERVTSSPCHCARIVTGFTRATFGPAAPDSAISVQYGCSNWPARSQLLSRLGITTAGGAAEHRVQREPGKLDFASTACVVRSTDAAVQ